MNILEKVIYNLLKTEPFLANFLLNCQVEYDVKGVPTAGAMVDKSGIRFCINTEFFGKLSTAEQGGVVKHEIMHVLLEHCGSRVTRVEWRRNSKNMNIAMDCAINQYINDLPMGITLDGLSKQLEMTLLPFETWEYYYACIKKFVSENPDKCEPNDCGDHEYMMGSEEMDANQAKAIIKDIANKSLKASKGNVPSGLEGILGALNQTATVNWKQQLRNILASANSPKRKNTRMKIHRRYDLEQPGKKKLKTFVLGVCLDSSGSVSDEQYAMFMREVKSIATQTAITYLVHADCAVHKVDTIKDGKAKSEVLSKRHGNGGTAYQPAITKCMELQCDAIVYFGDMDSADEPKNPGIPFIWARVGSQEPPGNFGKTVDVV